MSIAPKGDIVLAKPSHNPYDARASWYRREAVNLPGLIGRDPEERSRTLAGSLRVVIRPSGSHPDILTIQDAVEQIRDLFALADSDRAGVAWKLVFATTNTPLTVAGEMVAMVPDLAPEELAAIAHQATAEFDEGLAALMDGGIIAPWAQGRKAESLKRVLARTLNGIGRTDIHINDEAEAEVLTPTVAAVGLRAIERLNRAAGEIDRSRTEVGSIEGEYLQLGHHYAHPAIKVRERKTGHEVWCWLSEHDLKKFSDTVRAEDVWRRRRMKARGKIIFNSIGEILHVETIDVQLIDVPKVTVDEVRDPRFTGGLNVSAYLDRFREGELG